MKLLLHMCCGPCAVFPLSFFAESGIAVDGYFFNPNIHPFLEFKQRIHALETVADQFNVNVHYDKNYGLRDFLRKTVFHEEERCSICYDLRLSEVASFCKANGYDAFSTTLLYSRYQNHSLLIEKCERLSHLFNVEFFYRDFREGWQIGIDKSKALGIYRQKYCGCIFSEQESFDKHFRKNRTRNSSSPV